MHRVKSKKERYYYFYIDNWEKPSRLCFMERGIRRARVLAFIDAQLDMINRGMFLLPTAENQVDSDLLICGRPGFTGHRAPWQEDLPDCAEGRIKSELIQINSLLNPLTG
jgi:hypothetical protein